MTTPTFRCQACNKFARRDQLHYQQAGDEKHYLIHRKNPCTLLLFQKKGIPSHLVEALQTKIREIWGKEAAV